MEDAEAFLDHIDNIQQQLRTSVSQGSPAIMKAKGENTRLGSETPANRPPRLDPYSA